MLTLTGVHMWTLISTTVCVFECAHVLPCFLPGFFFIPAVSYM